MPLRSQKARAVTRGAVRCSAWLGVSALWEFVINECLELFGVGCRGFCARSVYADNLVTASTKLVGKQCLKRACAVAETAMLLGALLLGEERAKGNELETALSRVETLLGESAGE